MRREHETGCPCIDSEGALKARNQWSVEGLNGADERKGEDAARPNQPVRLRHVLRPRSDEEIDAIPVASVLAGMGMEPSYDPRHILSSTQPPDCRDSPKRLVRSGPIDRGHRDGRP